MAVEIPGCCDTQWELLRKILLSLDDIGAGAGGPVEVDNEGAPLTLALSSIDFVGAGVTATVVGNDVTVTISGSSTDVEAGSQAIGAGVDTISVVFGTPFAVAPVVVATVSRPVAENLIECNIDEASITVAGFTASLSATTASANYKLKWMAK